jgi:methylmalonyl-CoA mutase N-terminal domain/subunit
MQREIQESAYRYQMEIESGKRIIVGLNKFQMEEEPPKNLLKVDPQVEIVQREKIKKVKEMRDNARVEKALKALKKAAEGDDNLMPWILDAVREYATLGEITDVLRSVFGEYQQQIIF